MRDKGEVVLTIFILALIPLSIFLYVTKYADAYQVPPSVKPHCSRDVTQSILGWVASVPDGSTLSFGKRRCYRVDGTLEFVNRHGLTFEGNYATFRAFTTGEWDRAHWRFIGGSNITLRNMTIDGAHPFGGTHVPDKQWQHGVDLKGVAGVDIDVDVTDVYGDCFLVGMNGATWSSNVRVHDSTCARNGRQGVAVTAGRDVTVERNALSTIALDAFDIEPNGIGDGAQRVTVRDNIVTAPLGFSFLAAIGRGPVDDVTVADNTLEGKGLYMAFIAPVGKRRSGITVTGNTSDTPRDRPGGAALDFERIDGISATGNTAPLSGQNMAFAKLRESCDYSIFGNSFVGGVEEVRVESPCP